VAESEGREALAALAGRQGVIAITQDGEQFTVSVEQLEGDQLVILAPRLKVGGIESLVLHFSVEDHTWEGTFGFGSADFHSDELARVSLWLRSIEPLGEGVRAERTAVHADGKLRVIDARRVLARNEYPVTVEDVSATGLRFTCDFEISENDVFTVTAPLPDGSALHVRATAIRVEPAPFGRTMVRARIERTV
jgi:PilZ domain